MDILDKVFQKMLIEFIEKSDKPITDEIVKEATQHLLSFFENNQFEEINNNAKKNLPERRKLVSEFVERNCTRWSEGFDLLETFIIFCTDVGQRFNNFYRPNAAKENDILFDILVRLHARACHISQEILCLLKNGFADGAHARWRSLHEVSVTALFIAKHGENCAKRFYYHEAVEAYKGKLAHSDYHRRLNIDPIDQEEIESTKKIVDELKKELGSNFDTPYGWAAEALSIPKPNFQQIEQDVNLGHWRPYYKWSSQNIHSGAQGIRNRLATCEAKEEVLPVDRSDAGMTEPAHSTALSLGQVTSCLLQTKTHNVDSVIITKLILHFTDAIGKAFLKADSIKD